MFTTWPLLTAAAEERGHYYFLGGRLDWDESHDSPQN